MTRLIVALLLVFGLTTLASAGDHCFVQPYNAVVTPYGNYSQPYAYEDVDITQVDVINRQLKLYPTKQPQKDVLGEYVFAMEYQKILDTIPLTPAKQGSPAAEIRIQE
jgi:hypothetical protein